MLEDAVTQLTEEQQKDQIVDLENILLSHGITSVCNVGSLSGFVDTYDFYIRASKKAFVKE